MYVEPIPKPHFWEIYMAFIEIKGEHVIYVNQPPNSFAIIAATDIFKMKL